MRCAGHRYSDSDRRREGENEDFIEQDERRCCIRNTVDHPIVAGNRRAKGRALGTLDSAWPRVDVDHGAWDTFLKRYVSLHPDGVNRMDYAGVSEGDRKNLAAYVEQMARCPSVATTRTSREPTGSIFTTRSPSK